jgi:predicted metal-dependent phosphoesterase TrpH
MNYPRGIENWHSHTVISDGVQTHLEALAAAEQLGIGLMAFTDHDTLPDKAILKALREYDGPVKWTLGVELSSWVPVGGPDKGAVHILGLFTDVENKPLREFCAAAEHSRVERMRMYLKHFHEIGLDVTEAEVRAAATSRTIGKPHMVKAVMAKPVNQARVEELRTEMRQAAEHDEALRARYERMMADGPSQYPYVLFMGGEAFKPAPKSDFGTLLDYESSVKLIRGAGGRAFATHWYLEPEKFSQADLEKQLAAGGLDGVDCTINSILKRDDSANVELSDRLAGHYGVVALVTADSHKVADLETFVNSKFAARSEGMAERLVQKFQPDLRWSNLSK